MFTAEDLARTSCLFTATADAEFRAASPLYDRLARAIAQDQELLQLAAAGRNRKQPYVLLFFGAVQYLLLREPGAALARCYPALGGRAGPEEDPFPAFRAFCLEHADALREILQTRRVQTNEVGRCSVLLPAFGLLGDRRPLALLEVGASAGLNLNWNRYAYDYGAGRQAGDLPSPVRLECEIRGDDAPPLPSTIPTAAWSIGVDLDPVDPADEECALWLRALVWGDNVARATRLKAALQLAKAFPPRVVAGDAIEQLPRLVREAPDGATLCLFHTHVRNQFSAPYREAWESTLQETSRQRELWVISGEYQSPEGPPVLTLSRYHEGEHTAEDLASYAAHGQWLQWKGRDHRGF